MNQKPALWRVASYSAPGLPRPTSNRMMRRDYRCRSGMGPAEGAPKGPHGGRWRAAVDRTSCSASSFLALVGAAAWAAATGAGAASSSAACIETDTMTGSFVPCVTTLMPSGSFRSLTCSDWPLARLTGRWSGELGQLRGQALDQLDLELTTWLTRHLSVLTAGEFSRHEVQRHLLVTLVVASTRWKSTCSTIGRKVHLVVAQQHLLVLPPSSISRMEGGRLPSSARRRGRCDRARSWGWACRHRRRCRAPCPALRRRRLAPVPCRLRSKATNFMVTPNRG